MLAAAILAGYEDRGRSSTALISRVKHEISNHVPGIGIAVGGTTFSVWDG
ncbi:Hypothetical protein A7982_10147 [Minicystis rosea]|nr:Hypothetical protein A7982_10147 [Minicystis rosea]